MPRSVAVEVYKFEELSPKAKERARDEWRQGEDFGQIHSEVEATLNAFEKTFGCKVVKWSYGISSYAEVKVSAPELDDGQTVESYIEARLPKGDYPLTGVYFDDEVLAPLRDGAHKGEKDLEKVLEECVRSLFACAVEAMEDSMTDENVDDAIIANDYEFTADGKFWTGTSKLWGYA